MACMTLVNSPKSITIETLKEAKQQKWLFVYIPRLAYDYEVAPSWHHSWIPSHRFAFGGAKLTFRLSSLRGSFGGFFLLERDDSKEEQNKKGQLMR